MAEKLDFTDYMFSYSNRVKQIRRQLSAELRPVLDEIEDALTENPDQFPNQTIELTEDIQIYRHPRPQLEITYRIDRERKILYFLHLVAPQLDVVKPLFISYSHQDEELLIELKKWLKPLEKENLVQIWDDKKIKAGDEWRKEIEDALNTAKAAILLVSQDFLNSDFITTSELPVLLKAAEEKGIKILWIAVKASTVEDSEINKFQAAHKDPPLIQLNPVDRDKEYLKIYRKIKEAIK